jgi:ribonucleoside-triphosphate reductase
MKVIKRDGRVVKFDRSKIVDAILAAVEHHSYKGISYKEVKEIADEIYDALESKFGEKDTDVESIQDLVVSFLKKHKHNTLAKVYDEYRKERNRIRENKLAVIQSIEKIGVQTDRDNANVGNNFSAKLLRIASEANK